jgi:hypothetical protein
MPPLKKMTIPLNTRFLPLKEPINRHARMVIKRRSPRPTEMRHRKRKGLDVVNPIREREAECIVGAGEGADSLGGGCPVYPPSGLNLPCGRREEEGRWGGKE